MRQEGYLEEVDGLTPAMLTAAYRQMLRTANIELLVLGCDAAVQCHGKAHGCQLLRLHGLPQCEQHTQLCLHHIVVFGLVHRSHYRRGI